MLAEAEDELFREGALENFRALYNRFSPLLESKLRRRIRSRHDREDIIHATWMRVLKHRERLAVINHLDSWIWHICRNVATDFERAVQRRARLNSRYRVEVSAAQGEYFAVFVDDDKEMTIETVRHIVCGLPQRQFEIAALRWLFGVSTHDTARILGVAPGTAKATLSHVREKIRKMCASSVSVTTKPVMRALVLLVTAPLFQTLDSMLC